ncbi:MAG: T9SS type A sorting domain-containing protein [Ignavibacteriales bacterium]|nr:T9SS type A sorting domain-containing protein [Ignavibacteriales bacterium]
MSFKDNLLFIINWNCLSIYKAVSPTDLQYCSNYYYGTVYPENRNAIQVINKTLFGIADYTGLHILNIDDPYSVKELKSYKFPDITYSMYVNNEKIYVSSMNNGVYEIDNTFLTNVNEQNKMPNECLLFQNFPNPFNPSTTIYYQIPQAGFVSLKVFDILGREVATMVNEEKPVGNYEITFSGQGLPSGIYFYKLNAGNFSSVKKMILIK